MLDKTTKFFSASTKAPKTSKAIDFISIAEGMLQLEDLVSGSEAEVQTPTNNTTEFHPLPRNYEGSDVANERSIHSSGLSEVLDATLTIKPPKHQTSGSPYNELAVLTDSAEMESTKDWSEVLEVLTFERV